MTLHPLSEIRIINAQRNAKQRSSLAIGPATPRQATPWQSDLPSGVQPLWFTVIAVQRCGSTFYFHAVGLFLRDRVPRMTTANCRLIWNVLPEFNLTIVCEVWLTNHNLFLNYGGILTFVVLAMCVYCDFLLFRCQK